MSGIQIQPFFCVLVCLSYVVFFFVGVAQRNNERLNTVRYLCHLGRIANWKNITRPRPQQNKSSLEAGGGEWGEVEVLAVCWCACMNVERSRKFCCWLLKDRTKLENKSALKTRKTLCGQWLVHCFGLKGKYWHLIYFHITFLLHGIKVDSDELFIAAWHSNTELTKFF